MASHLPFLISLLLYFAALCSPASARNRIPAIIVFGDSTVDTGNNNGIKTVLKSDFPPYGRDFITGKPTGRFGNGRLATEFIAEGLGLGPVVPAYLDPTRTIKDFATAVCFASAGTGLDNATSDVLNVLPIWKELQYFTQYHRHLRQYLGRSAAHRTIMEALYVLSIGTNDFLENYFLLITGRFKQFTIGEYQDFLVNLTANFITEIYRFGARRIMVTGLSPMGCLPLERTTNLFGMGECNDEYNGVALEYNAKVEVMVAAMRATLPGLWLKVDRIYDVMLEMIQNPAQYGFENVGEGCCATGKFELGYLCNEWSPYTCPDADKYVFWDSFHPTQRVNSLIAANSLRTTLSDLLE